MTVDSFEEQAAAGAEGDGTRFPILPVRLVQIFVSPTELFSRLVERPVWFGALLLGGVFVALGTYLIPPDLMLTAMREQIVRSGGDVPTGFEDRMGLFRTTSLVVGPFFWALLQVILAGVVMAMFSFVLGEEGRFRQYLSIVAHANLIGATSYLALVPLRIAVGDPGLVLSVAALVPLGGDGYLGDLLGLLDLFGLWTWAVAALGVSVLSGRRSWKSTVGPIMLIPLVIAAVGALFR